MLKILAATDAERTDGYEGSLLMLAGLLTLLRWLTAGAAVAILGALARAGVRPLPWQDPIPATLIAGYILGAGLVFLLGSVLRRYGYSVLEFGLLLDLVVLIALSLATAGATALLVLPALFAIGIVRHIWAGLLAGALFCLHLIPIWPPAQALARLPPTSLAVLTGLMTILALTWVSLVAGSNARVDREATRHARRRAQQTQERTRLALQRTRGLYHVAQTLSSTLNYESVLRDIFAEFEQALPFDVALVLLIEPGTHLLYVSASFGLTKEEVDRKLDGRSGQLGRAAAGGNPLILRDLPTESELIACWPRLAGFASALVMPLRSRFELFGVIVTAQEQGRYDQEQLDLLTALGNHAVVALQNAQLYAALREERDRLLGKDEDVRRQLARDLHDGPTQTLAAITMHAEFMKKLLVSAPERVPAEMDALIAMARKANQDVRTLLFELRPVILESSGLPSALSQYVARFPPTELPRVYFEGADVPVRLPPAVESTIFNIVQEAINNARKHARARNIWVTLRSLDAKLVIAIRDDGQGFEVAAQSAAATKRGSYGLLNMRERAATAQGEIGITSLPGRGTTITLTVPLSGP